MLGGNANYSDYYYYHDPSFPVCILLSELLSDCMQVEHRSIYVYRFLQFERVFFRRRSETPIHHLFYSLPPTVASHLLPPAAAYSQSHRRARDLPAPLFCPIT